jgi:hypothetical protein
VKYYGTEENDVFSIRGVLHAKHSGCPTSHRSHVRIGDAVQNHRRNKDGNIANNQVFFAQHCTNQVTGFRVMPGETEVQT